MKPRIFLIPVILIFVTACKKNTPDDKNTGKVTFYTNAQLVLNCGPFDVEVYIDSSLAGTLESSFLPTNEAPACNASPGKTILSVNKPEGEYEFTARLTCSETLKYLGNFKIKKDSCSLVFIDLTYRE